MFCPSLTAHKLNRKFGVEIQKFYVFFVILSWPILKAIISEITRQRRNTFGVVKPSR